jgi:hypothetical protein
MLSEILTSARRFCTLLRGVRLAPGGNQLIQKQLFTRKKKDFIERFGTLDA